MFLRQRPELTADGCMENREKFQIRGILCLKAVYSFQSELAAKRHHQTDVAQQSFHAEAINVEELTDLWTNHITTGF